MALRQAFHPLQEQAPLTPHAEHAISAMPDLLCYETMPTPAELAEHVASRSIAPACWCFDQCIGPHCRDAPQNKNQNLKRKREYEPRGYTDPADSWPQRVQLWHPGDFEATPFTIEAGALFRTLFRDFCSSLGVERKSVRFVWQRTRLSGFVESVESVESVELRDKDAPWDLGFREGRTEHIECEYI